MSLVAAGHFGYAALMNLAPYAVQSQKSRGRLHREASPAGRSEYQRDRDRVVHSSAFQIGRAHV